MTPRAQEILFSIVRSYIETGEPQGSRTISRFPGSSLSAASIRNIMADLADDGYLMQPHTSAGRVPTVKAFQAYARALQSPRISGSDSRRIRQELSGIGSLESRVERSSRLLMEISRAVGFAASTQVGGQELEHLELIGLADRRVLIVVVTRDRQASNRVITLDQQLTTEELAGVRNYINANFAGWQLEAARREIAQRLEEERAAYDAILQRLHLLCDKGLLAADSTRHIHLEGASNLVGLDLHLTRERMRDLFRTLEEKQRVYDLLDRFLENSENGLGVHIGLGQAHPAMSDLALIGLTVSMPGKLLMRIAVLGPMRMNYGRVMSAVLEIGRVFELPPHTL